MKCRQKHAKKCPYGSYFVIISDNSNDGITLLTDFTKALRIEDLGRIKGQTHRFILFASPFHPIRL